MSQFRSAGGLDEPIGEDVDRGFFSVNQRLQLNQLQEGEVRESLNGRMEGYWKPRKGVVEKTAALTTGQIPLQLPFYLVSTSEDHYNLTEGSEFLITEGSEFVITQDEAVASTSKPITNVQIPATGTVRITIVEHGFEADSSGWANISGLDSSFNGSYLLTYFDENSLDYAIAGVTIPPTDKIGLLSQMPINNVANANVKASCLFSDPNSSNKEYVIVAMDTTAKKIDLATLDVTNVSYPAGQALGANSEMIQLFDKIMLFRDGQQALEWYPNGRPIISASSNATASPNTIVTMNVREHGLLAGTSITISGITGGTAPNGTYVVASVPSQDIFTFVASGISTSTTFVTTGATATDGFTLSPGGVYTQPQTFKATGSVVTASNGLITMEISGNVSLRIGDIVVVYECTIPELIPLVGKEFQLTSATATQLQFYAPVPNITTGSASEQIEVGGRFSVGGGFMHQPAAPWGVYFQRRLWVPYYYDQSGPFNAPVYTSRKISDEISVSDILDTTTFDRIENQFRISGGTADYVVGMHGFYDDALVVLNRNSLHIVKGTLGSLLDCTVKELTSEIGCLARKSVIMRGNSMMFLSDDGVYSLEFLNDYNLRGAEEPISKNIQPYIDRINKVYAEEAVGILFDNRYYLAVALDSAVGADDARGNNSILVYNFKNKGWESLDTYGDPRFLIKNLITGGAGVRNELYAVTQNGGLHQIDAVERDSDRFNVSNSGGLVITSPINASLTTRGYDFKTMERKRFTDAQINMQNLAGDVGEYDIYFTTQDPDTSEQIINSTDPIGSTTQFLGGVVLSPSSPNEAETASIRCRLAGIRGYTGTLILTRTIGSPKINSVKVAGSVTNRQIISQK